MMFACLFEKSKPNVQSKEWRVMNFEMCTEFLSNDNLATFEGTEVGRKQEIYE